MTVPAAAERSHVRWGTTLIPYAVQRSGRRRTVAVAVDPDRGVVLTAPLDTPVERLDRIVRAKSRWIVDHLRRHGDVPPAAGAREFVSGEGYTYLGGHYRLRLIEGGSPQPVALRGRWLELPVPAGVPDEHRAAFARAALVDWYRKQAQRKLPGRADSWATRTGVARTQVQLRDQHKRWGSCDARGVVRINWRIVQAPISLVDYVLAHEMVHRLHRQHDAAFWSALGRLLPDYEERRELLCKIGPRLVW